MQTYTINGERYVVMTQAELDLTLELHGVTDTNGLPHDPFSDGEHMVDGIRVQRFSLNADNMRAH